MNKLFKTILMVLLSIGFIFSIACADDVQKSTPRINIEETNVYVYVGETYQLNVEKTSISKNLEYFVEHPSIASISDSGLVTGLSEGSTIITVRAGNLQDSCRVVVSKVGASIEEFPFISVASEDISVNLDGNYILYPELMVGEEIINDATFNITVVDPAIFEATIDGDLIKILPLKVGSSTLCISVDYNGNIVEKYITVNVLEAVTEMSVTGYITESGICSVEINGISGQNASVYFGDKTIAASVYPDSISFSLNENEMSLLDGKRVGDEISITVFGDNGKVYSTKIKVFSVEKYQGNVYLQPNGQIKGLSGHNSISFAGKNFEINTLGNNTFVSGEKWLNVKNSLVIGDIINASVMLEEKVVEIPIKYVTLAISNYEELTQIENGSINHYVLMNDIDCSGQKWENKDRTEFASILDGNGYAIRNLTIANTSSSQYNGYSDNTFVGTHGWKCKFITMLGESAVIKNVVFDGVKSYGDITKTALFGRNAGLIENVVVSIAAPTIDGFGGLVGDNAGTIKNCVLDYTVQDKWVMGYIATTNGGTIENVIVNCPTAFETAENNTFKLVGTENKEITNCVKVKKSKADMLSYIDDINLKALYNNISINALSVGAKTEMDFNGTTVNGYTVSLAKEASFGFTSDYILDLKNRNIVSVRVWINGGAYVQIMPTSNGELVADNRNDWQCAPNTWTALNMGRNYNAGTNANRLFSDDVITPDHLAWFNVYNTGSTGATNVGTQDFKVYIEEFTADTVPVISGKDYTTSTAIVGDATVTTYRVEFTKNDSVIGFDSAISGFMISEAYLDNLAAEGYTSITLMLKTDGLFQTAVGFYDKADDWKADWRNGTVLSDWTEVNHTKTSAPYTIEEAKKLHIQGLTGNGLSCPTYVEFYIVAHK